MILIFSSSFFWEQRGAACGLQNEHITGYWTIERVKGKEETWNRYSLMLRGQKQFSPGEWRKECQGMSLLPTGPKLFYPSTPHVTFRGDSWLISTQWSVWECIQQGTSHTQQWLRLRALAESTYPPLVSPSVGDSSKAASTMVLYHKNTSGYIFLLKYFSLLLTSWHIW